MKKLQLDLKNCYGIQNLEQTINFSKDNVAVIYAPNGTMKSSFAKTMAAIHDGRPVEEQVYHEKSTYKVTDEHGNDIAPENIMVINPFQENVCEEQGLLMANEKLREQYARIHSEIAKKKEELYRNVKLYLGYSVRKQFQVREVMLRDWGFAEKNEYECLKVISSLINDKSMDCALSEWELNYEVLFHPKVCEAIQKKATSDLIAEYEKQYNELMDRSLYMQKGVIDHNNYGRIGDALQKNRFFEANNEIVLHAKDGSTSVLLKNETELQELIQKEKDRVLNTEKMKEIFQKINTLLSKNKDMQQFDQFLQNHPEIIAEYKDMELFRKKVWVKAFAWVCTSLDELLGEYEKAQDELKKIRKEATQEKTDWENALELFSHRFYVPFTIETSNQDDVILNMAMPSFRYIFKDNRGEREVTKDNLLSVLSTGERRAYYILNMIFRIMVAQKLGKECLIVMDDISESFDYKNKYAIIEYVNDISQFTDAHGEKLFKIILLTHNFDFYRTVASRVSKNVHIAFSNEGKLEFVDGQYTRSLFSFYKNNLHKDIKFVLASIPFVRNLIEYIDDTKNKDYLRLTYILHYKNETKEITLKEVENIFNEYWCKNKPVHFADGREEETILDLVMEEADRVEKVENLDLKKKLILSMAIRLKAEIYMIRRIREDVEDGDQIIDKIYAGANQSGKLLEQYRIHIHDDATKAMEMVSMLTPENIHLNSFMFEPLLDMSLVRLYDLYQEVKALEEA